MKFKLFIVGVITALSSLVVLQHTGASTPESVSMNAAPTSVDRVLTHTWVNFSTGYANSYGRLGDVGVQLRGVSGYQPNSVRFVVDDNGDNKAVAVSWSKQCWDEDDIVNSQDSTTVDPPFTVTLSVFTSADRCEVAVWARHPTDGVDGHIDVSLQATYAH